MKHLLGKLVLVAALALGVPSPAVAADEVGVSWDGQSWSSHLAEPLFDPSVRWVPGDVREVSFFVRNQASDAGHLTISVESRDRDHLLRNGDIDLSAKVGRDRRVRLEQTDRTFRLSSDSLSGGESRRIRIRASYDPTSTNATQRDDLALSFRVTLADASATNGGAVTDGSPDESDRLLPGTGAPATGWLIVTAGVGMGVGAALMRRKDRKEAGTGHGTTH
ncbi:hypothetical protein ncot_10140 [Nocardioides sp. JQ2195]|uniref:hypothetical protein n=1 Tax=Nocardioides sp. JQ2195 TaxID=2592334 RepID=UPI00143EB0AF|nr:hypothetical protein [Nocardioides sp. JQ2195]QIX26923.1 hypothetical protein ncot_10140 [Nocardioides sp. JQ2195]